MQLRQKSFRGDLLTAHEWVSDLEGCVSSVFSNHIDNLKKGESPQKAEIKKGNKEFSESLAVIRTHRTGRRTGTLHKSYSLNRAPLSSQLGGQVHPSSSLWGRMTHCHSIQDMISHCPSHWGRMSHCPFTLGRKSHCLSTEDRVLRSSSTWGGVPDCSSNRDRISHCPSIWGQNTPLPCTRQDVPLSFFLERGCTQKAGIINQRSLEQRAIERREQRCP